MGDWTLDECLSLIDQVRHQLPNSTRDTMIYSKRMRKLDFDSIAVAGKTKEECQEKVSGLLQRVRKVRTLSEMFDQFGHEFLNDPRDAFNKYLCRASRPKPPQTIYMQRHMDSLRAKSGDSDSMQQVVKYAMKKYHDLPEDKKKKYLEQYQTELEHFKVEMEKERLEFLGPRGDGIEAIACNLYVNKKVDKKMAKFPDADKTLLMGKYRDRWHGLDEERRKKYLDEAETLQKAEQKATKAVKAGDKLKKKSQQTTVSNGIASSTENDQSDQKTLAKGLTSIGLFIKDYMASGHSYKEASDAWKALSDEERFEWKQKALQAAGRTKEKPKNQRKATAWSLFVHKHVAAGNTFKTASAAWKALSEKKRRKFVEKARAASQEATKNAKLNQTIDGGSSTPEPPQPVSQRKRPSTEPAQSKVDNKSKKIKPEVMDVSLLIEESRSEEDALNLPKNDSKKKKPGVENKAERITAYFKPKSELENGEKVKTKAKAEPRNRVRSSPSSSDQLTDESD